MLLSLATRDLQIWCQPCIFLIENVALLLVTGQTTVRRSQSLFGEVKMAVESNHILYFNCDSWVNSCGIIQSSMIYVEHALSHLLVSVSCTPKAKAVIATGEKQETTLILMYFVPAVVHKPQTTHFAMLHADWAMVGGPLPGKSHMFLFPRGWDVQTPLLSVLKKWKEKCLALSTLTVLAWWHCNCGYYWRLLYVCQLYTVKICFGVTMVTAWVLYVASTRQSWFWCIQEGGTGCTAGSQGSPGQEKTSEYQTREPGHTWGRAAQTTARTVCQGSCDTSTSLTVV